MLKNKTALITGASRGIGRAIAQLYAEHGCNIAFTYLYEEQEANNLVEQLQAKGVQVLCIHSDAADFNGGFCLGLCLGHIIVDQRIEIATQTFVFCHFTLIFFYYLVCHSLDNTNLFSVGQVVKKLKKGHFYGFLP